jgi:hypothetical protein
MVVEGNDAGSERKTLLWARRVWFRTRLHCPWLPSWCLLGTIALQVGSVGPWLYRSGDGAYDCVHNLNLDRRSCLPSIQVQVISQSYTTSSEPARQAHAPVYNMHAWLSMELRYICTVAVQMWLKIDGALLILDHHPLSAAYRLC